MTFSHYELDGEGQIILDAYTGKPIHKPAQHLWIRATDRWYHLSSFPMDEGGFQHRNAYWLEVERYFIQNRAPGEVYREAMKRKHAEEQKKREDEKAFRRDRARANSKRIGDLVFHNKSGRRQAKAASYVGQTVRSTPGDILPDAREDGWELER